MNAQAQKELGNRFAYYWIAEWSTYVSFFLSEGSKRKTKTVKLPDGQVVTYHDFVCNDGCPNTIKAEVRRLLASWRIAS